MLTATSIKVISGQGTELAPIFPLLMLEESWTRQQRILIAPTLGSPYPAIAVNGSYGKSGVFKFLLATVNQAKALDDMTNGTGVLSITSPTELPEWHGFHWAVAGNCEYSMEPDGIRFTASIPFQEVA